MKAEIKQNQQNKVKKSIDKIKKRKRNRKMKIAQTILKNMAAMGFTPNQQQQNNGRKLSFFQIIVVIILFIGIGTLFIFSFYEANNIEEYMDVIFELSAEVELFIIFLSFILKNDDVLNVIERTAKEITDSE